MPMLPTMSTTCPWFTENVLMMWPACDVMKGKSISSPRNQSRSSNPDLKGPVSWGFTWLALLLCGPAIFIHEETECTFNAHSVNPHVHMLCLWCAYGVPMMKALGLCRRGETVTQFVSTIVCRSYFNTRSFRAHNLPRGCFSCVPSRWPGKNVGAKEVIILAQTFFLSSLSWFLENWNH